MRNNIAYGSPMDDWFRRLTVNEKDMYEHLMEVFEKEWPLITMVKELKVERICALKEWVLKPEELGKKVDSMSYFEIGFSVLTGFFLYFLLIFTGRRNLFENFGTCTRTRVI
jgi:hypothetical protein